MRAYLDTPDIQDRVARGEVTGIRTDRVTYLFERAGHFVLPGVFQPWWELATQTPHTLTMPSRAIDVLAAPAPSRRQPRWVPVAEAGATVLAVGLAAVSLRRRVTGTWIGWRDSSVRRERRAFQALRRERRSADPAGTYRAWQAWNAFRPPRPMDPALASSVRDLEFCLFGRGRSWGRDDARRFVEAAAAMRTAPHGVRTRPGLPPLNPGGSQRFPAAACP